MKKKINLTNLQKVQIATAVSKIADEASTMLAGADIALKLTKNTKYKKQIMALTFISLSIETAANVAVLNYSGALEEVKNEFKKKLSSKKNKDKKDEDIIEVSPDGSVIIS